MKKKNGKPRPGFIMMRRALMALGLIAGLLLPLRSAVAVDFAGSGFLTLAAGRMLSGEASDAYFVNDYGQGGIYKHGRGWSAGPDSKLGLQGVATINSEWSATGQVVSRGARDGKVNLEWLFLSYRLSENTTLQVGRKRLPLFYYSEAQDVGIALPWLRLPPPAYGWDVVNFNGANLTYRNRVGEWNSAVEAFFGNERRRDNPYLELYNGRGSNWDERWKNIGGVAWTLSHDWLELRFSYVGSGLEYWDTHDKANTLVSSRQSFYSLAAVVDRDNWLVRAEASKIRRPGDDFQEKDWAALFGVGYRFGKWLPMVTFARFQGKYLDGRPNERFSDLSLSLRYDLSPSTALKLQYDAFKDRSDEGISSYSVSQRYGNSRLIGIAYDMVF